MLLRLLAAFLAGGTLCALLQIAVDRTALTPARILTGTVVAGVILSGLGLYRPPVQAPLPQAHPHGSLSLM